MNCCVCLCLFVYLLVFLMFMHSEDPGFTAYAMSLICLFVCLFDVYHVLFTPGPSFPAYGVALIVVIPLLIMLVVGLIITICYCYYRKNKIQIIRVCFGHAYTLVEVLLYTH